MSPDVLPRVLVAEDDPLLRALLDAVLRPDFPELILVENGLEAIRYLHDHPVDVLLTDWMMPEMDGIELIRRVRADLTDPPFMIMNTVLGSSDARAHALRSGADDFLAKPARPAELRYSIERGAQRRSSCQSLPKARPVFFAPPLLSRGADGPPPAVVVAIAASTGGPATLIELFSSNALPTSSIYLVALHGPEWLHQTIVECLRRVSRLTFALGEDGALATPGTVHFACNDRHLTIDKGARLRFVATPPEHFLRPAADPMLRSVARSFGRSSLAVVLTGMGHDGAAGCGDIVAAGGTVLAQDPATAIVGTMPRAVIDSGFATEVLPLSALGRGVARHVESLTHALAKARLALPSS